MANAAITRDSIVQLVKILNEEARQNGSTAVLVHGVAMIDELVDEFLDYLNMKIKIRLPYEGDEQQDLLNRNTVQDRRGALKETR